MRLAPIPPKELSEEQKPIAAEIQYIVDHVLKGFVANNEDGALLGPFTAMLHFPQYGAAALAFTKAIGVRTTIAPAARELAILVTGSHFRARYEIYAHSRVAESVGLSAAKIATITAGQRPVDLTELEAAAYDLTFALVKGCVISDFLYKHALEVFGEKSLAELVCIIGNYCLVCLILNTYNISVPGE